MWKSKLCLLSIWTLKTFNSKLFFRAEQNLKTGWAFTCERMPNIFLLEGSRLWSPYLQNQKGLRRPWNMTNYHVDPNCRPILHNCLIYVNLPTIIPATLAWCWHKARIYNTYIREAPKFKITWIDSKQTLTYRIAGPPSGQLEPQNVLTIESTWIGIVKIVSGYFQRFITFQTKQHKTFRLYLTNLMSSVAGKSVQNSRKVIKLEDFLFCLPTNRHM